MPNVPAIPPRFPAAPADGLMYLLGRICTTELHCVLTLAGRVDESRLRAAMRRSLDAEPVLGCRLVDHWRRPYWQRREDLDSRLPCTLVETAQTSAEVARFVAARVDPCRDPLAQVRIVRDTHDTLCIKIAHEAADAPSARDYCRLLLATYQRLGGEPDYRPPVNLGQRSMDGISERFTLRQKAGHLWNLVRQRRALLGGGSWLRPEPAGSGTEQGHLLMRIDAPRVDSLRQLGRECGATITSVVLAAFARALHAVLTPAGAGAACIGTTVDLRRFLPHERLPTAVSNIASPMGLWLDARSTPDFGALVRLVAGKLEVLADPSTAPGVLPLVLLYPVANALFATIPFALQRRRFFRRAAPRIVGSPTFDAFLYNSGRLDAIADELGGLPVEDLYTCGPLGVGSAMFLEFNGFRGRLTIALRYSGRLVGQAPARRLLEELDRALPFSNGCPAAIECLAAM